MSGIGDSMPSRDESWEPGCGQVHPTGGYDAIDENSLRTIYRRDGLMHRDDGPAVVWPDGLAEWYSNDVLHRTDGPAREHHGGRIEWFVDGQRHRGDGPAVTHRVKTTGYDEWWFEGKRYTEEQFAFLREALDDGAPHEWARAFARGSAG